MSRVSNSKRVLQITNLTTTKYSILFFVFQYHSVYYKCIKQKINNYQTHKDTTCDAFIDDNIEMCKRLKKMKVKLDVLIVNNDCPHGFLNMQTMCDQTHEAFEETLKLLKELVNEMLRTKSTSSV